MMKMLHGYDRRDHKQGTYAKKVRGLQGILGNKWPYVLNEPIFGTHVYLNMAINVPFLLVDFSFTGMSLEFVH